MKSAGFLLLSVFQLFALSAVGQVSFGQAEKINDNWKFALNLKEEQNVSSQQYDDANWNGIDLPHDWSVKEQLSPTYASSMGYLPGGIAWYRKTLDISQNKKGEKIYLYFEGVYNRSEVFINGHLLGSRPNGYISFMYDITPYINYDKANVVAVRVDHSQSADSRWYTGSGIYRDVWLVYAHPVHIAQWGVYAYPHVETHDRASLQVEIEIENGISSRENLTVVNELLTSNNKVVAKDSQKLTVQAKQNGKITTNLNIKNPQLWNLDNPNLYTLKTTVLQDGKMIDETTTTTGFRSFTFNPDHGFALNGEYLKMKGVCIHHDAGVLGAAVPKEVWKRRLLTLKEIGVNAIRTSHNPQAPDLYDLCDELGLLVLNEAYDEWEFPKNKWIAGWNVGTPGHQGSFDIFEKWGEQDLADMVRRDRNHLSVFAWSIGNEVDYPNDPYSHPILDGNNRDFTQALNGGYKKDAPDANRLGGIAKRLVAVVKQYDQSRPVTAGLAGVAMSNETEYPGALDITGYNYTESRYVSDHKKYPNRVIFGSETRHDLAAWKAVTENEHIFGQFLWTGIDYLGESGAWPSRGFYSGLLDFGGFIKPRGYFRQSLWSDQPMAYIGTYPAPQKGNWLSQDARPIWNYEEGQTIRVVCYTNTAKAKLLLNGKSIGEIKDYDNQTGITSWDIPYQAGKLEVIGMDKDNNELANYSIQSSKQPYALAIQSGETIINREKGLSQIVLQVVDENGIPVMLSDNEITCRIEGPAKLLGLEAGNNSDMSDYTDNRQRVFLGRILAYIQATGQAGTAKIRFSSPWLQPTEVEITNKTKETFEIDKQTFLLNGEPFVIKAAEIHYPRIPKEYWEHRIQMCKALGMNTICLYVFWNIHEPVEGQYDFTGNNDVAEFCRLAQKNGMYVIVRPGPYVCAEWEMGGLPWWLLKKENIALRTQDPYFMERVKLFMAEVGKQLSNYQLANGGNILMVQVENEYGAYGVDKPYIEAVRDIVKASGFDKAPLFQCDWSSNFENNALPDLLWTLNFGTGANIDEQFRRLKELRPETPLMCSEFWSGWFDHWGAQHETRSAAELVAGLKEMLDKHISFSLYMTHGGTSFGHWAGANFPGYVPDCTSYDYDAPINEQGNRSPKFFEVRNLLANYLPEGKKLPAIPDSIKTIAIPTITFEESANIFDNLPKPQTSEDIHSMEYFNQGWGSILYRTTLSKSEMSQYLKVTEAHDWAQVYVDGIRIGVLNRLKGESSLQLPPVREGAVLDILVEAMGRRNFGAGVLDYKGITEKVEIINEQGATTLKKWQVYSFPVDYDFAKNKSYVVETWRATSLQEKPAYYRASFNLDKTGDTFLDMTHWKKGMVYVNGHNLGRYWEIGPQQTLYLPGVWLKKGKNEIIILDMVGTETPTVQGIRQPILDVLRGNGAYKFRKQGENLDLSAEKAVASGSFKPGNGWQKISFNKNIPARYFTLEALSSYSNDDFASIAELEILGEDGKRLSRQHWKVVYADSEEADDANHIASNVFDLQESTIWHTSYSLAKDKFPHSIVIDLGEDKVITGFEYLPRMESNKPGMIKDYKVYVKTTPFKL